MVRLLLEHLLAVELQSALALSQKQSVSQTFITTITATAWDHLHRRPQDPHQECLHHRPDGPSACLHCRRRWCCWWLLAGDHTNSGCFASQAGGPPFCGKTKRVSPHTTLLPPVLVCSPTLLPLSGIYLPFILCCLSGSEAITKLITTATTIALVTTTTTTAAVTTPVSPSHLSLAALMSWFVDPFFHSRQESRLQFHTPLFLSTFCIHCCYWSIWCTPEVC